MVNNLLCFPEMTSRTARTARTDHSDSTTDPAEIRQVLKAAVSAVAAAAPAARTTTDVPKHLRGRTPDGIYPHISRKLVAVKLKRHITSIANYFTGEQSVPEEIVPKLAKLCGVSVAELQADLQKQRVVRAKQKVRKLEKG